jgi:hypothetical protein
MVLPLECAVERGHNRHSGANVEKDGPVPGLLGRRVLDAPSSSAPDSLEFGNTNLEAKRSGVLGTGDDRRGDPRVINPENDSVHSHHRWDGISP